MPTTVTFSICSDCDCTGLIFSDTTGRQPGVSTGYDTGLDLSFHTGTLEIFDTTLSAPVRTYTVTVSADATFKQNILWTEGGQTKLADGVYLLRYTVKDASDNVVGFQKQLFVLGCDYRCKLLELAKNSIYASGNKYEMLKESIIAARDSLVFTRLLANAGKMDKASEEFALGIKYLNNC